MLVSVILNFFGHTGSLSLLYSSPIIIPVHWDRGQLSPGVEIHLLEDYSGDTCF